MPRAKCQAFFKLKYHPWPFNAGGGKGALIDGQECPSYYYGALARGGGSRLMRHRTKCQAFFKWLRRNTLFINELVATRLPGHWRVEWPWDGACLTGGWQRGAADSWAVED